MIIPVWQKKGESSHLLAEKCGSLLGQKATHTGTLDPMAEGVVVILTDEDRFAKGSLTDWLKTYEFSILWGVKTDSGDQLGMILQQSDTLPTIEDLRRVIKGFPVSYEQKTPAFSAQRWNGKSGFDWAKMQNSTQNFPEKRRSVKLTELSFLGQETLSAKEVFASHAKNINTLTGDFRQQEVLENWNRSLSHSKNFLITRHRVITSPGTYIRELVQDLATPLNIPATTWSITRTGNGPFEKQDCVDLLELQEI